MVTRPWTGGSAQYLAGAVSLGPLPFQTRPPAPRVSAFGVAGWLESTWRPAVQDSERVEEARARARGPSHPPGAPGLPFARVKEGCARVCVWGDVHLQPAAPAQPARPRPHSPPCPRAAPARTPPRPDADAPAAAAAGTRARSGAPPRPRPAEDERAAGPDT